MNPASDHTGRRRAFLQDLQNHDASFIERATRALVAIGASDIAVVRRFEQQGQAEFAFIRDDAGDMDVRARLEPFGVCIVPDRDAESQ